MDLSPVKLEILQALLLFDKPVKALQVAKEVGKKLSPVQMHLLGLVKMGYAQSPQKGAYIISLEGKKVAGLPEVTAEQAKSILRQVPDEKAFHFYTELEKPTKIYARSLTEFCNKLPQVPTESILFHVCRGDFEAWLKGLGELELATRIAMLKDRKLGEEELRSRVLGLASKRCTELSELAQ
jgi:hypothetical protein